MCAEGINRRFYMLHARTRAFQDRVARTQNVVKRFIRDYPEVYVSWSGGKDSSVVLDLATNVRADIPVLCVQTDIEYPDNLEIVEKYRKMWPDMTLILVHPETSAWEYLTRSADVFREVNVASSKLDRLFFYEPIQKEVEAQGYNAYFLGLRKEESRARLLGLTFHGMVYEKQDGMTVCCPLSNWSGRDVMGYLVSRDLPISSIYEKTRFHPEPERVREGWWIPGAQAVALGGMVWLRYYYPDYYRRLIAVRPELSHYV